MSQFLTAKKNKEFVVKIAGRETHYAKLNDSKSFAKRGKVNTDRFEALNLQNPKTVEFRLFKATTNKEAFFSRMEFVDALTEFCKMGETGITEVLHGGPDKFKAFVHLNKKYYPNLHKTCQEHTKEELAANPQGKE